MKLSATREQILAPLQSVIGVVERRQTMPVLSNVLLAARNNRVSVTGTDLEVELVATSEANVQQPGDITVPGRKLLDIFRALPEKTAVTIRNTSFISGNNNYMPVEIEVNESGVFQIRELQQGYYDLIINYFLPGFSDIKTFMIRGIEVTGDNDTSLGVIDLS